MRDWWSILRFYGVFALAYLAFTSVAYAQYYIPSGSMRPTMEVGDRLLVNKFAFGWSRYSLPILLAEQVPLEGRVLARTPERGDVVVFRSPVEPVVVIKRVIGLPGETIELRGGQVFIDGERILLKAEDDAGSEAGLLRLREHLRGRTYAVYDQGPTMADTFGPYVVPDDCYFVLGDNRDDSSDSRFWGCVPMENMIGRAEFIGWTLAWLRPDSAYARRSDRFWRPL